jgi:hypothetical protein
MAKQQELVDLAAVEIPAVYLIVDKIATKSM